MPAGFTTVSILAGDGVTSKTIMVYDDGTAKLYNAVVRGDGAGNIAPAMDVSARAGFVQVVPGTSGGETPYSYIAAASANQDSQVIKASPGQVYGWQLFNTTAAIRYVKVYDKATAPISTDTPVKRFMLPAGGGASGIVNLGGKFLSGIAFRITLGYADADANAVTAGDVLVNFDYA